MKKTKLKDVMPFFPITVQNAKIVSRKKTDQKNPPLLAKDYQSSDVNSQQLYKPISKIIHFQ